MLKIHPLESPEQAAQAILAVMQDDQLSFRARGVLGMLLSHAGETWEVGTLDSFAVEIAKRQAEVAGRTASGEGQQSLRKVFRELEAAGYITRQPMGKGVYRGSCVEVHPVPAEAGAVPALRDLGEGSIVYLIAEASSSIVKIGTTRDVRKRRQVLQVNHPRKLEILWQTPGGWGLEHYLHTRFASRRLEGEWFDFGGADPVEAVRSAVSDHSLASPT
ncbi:GIY-YIG nuclease family protein [Streptomyces sp. SAS_275]|uniref:GIY-YIG nuclease family protein n=1 Tax=Streptomyces sp. SAS_275 TaxID=3412746 RepID=UPI00403CD2BB